MYTSKLRQLRPGRACSAGGVWWLCSVPKAELPVQHVPSVPQHLCRVFRSLLSTMCHGAFVPQSVPFPPHPPYQVRPHIVI